MKKMIVLVKTVEYLYLLYCSSKRAMNVLIEESVNWSVP